MEIGNPNMVETKIIEIQLKMSFSTFDIKAYLILCETAAKFEPSAANCWWYFEG